MEVLQLVGGGGGGGGGGGQLEDVLVDRDVGSTEAEVEDIGTHLPPSQHSPFLQSASQVH